MERNVEREDDAVYFERRAREERAKAENAADPIAGKLHAEFAKHYERRLAGPLRRT